MRLHLYAQCAVWAYTQGCCSMQRTRGCLLSLLLIAGDLCSSTLSRNLCLGLMCGQSLLSRRQVCIYQESRVEWCTVAVMYSNLRTRRIYCLDAL